MNVEKVKEEHSLVAQQGAHVIEFVIQQLNALLVGVGVHVAVPIQHRIKTIDSVLEKANRKEIELTSLHEFDDLIGIRVILLNQIDLDLVKMVVERNFKIHISKDKSHELGASQFGYRSIHYVTQLSEQWSSLPIFIGYIDYKIEVQIRTLSQHVWADLSHKLQYKNENSIPKEISRAVYRVSALLETVDLEINRVFDLRDNYIQNEIRKDNALNANTLELILDQVFPQNNKRPPEQYSDLISDLSAFNITTVQAINDILNKHSVSAIEMEKHMSYMTGNPFYTHTGLASQAITREFGKPWTERRNETNAQVLLEPQ